MRFEAITIGFHTPDNLQILSAKENLMKGNKLINEGDSSYV